MKRSFIISTVFFLCAFFLISATASATITYKRKVFAEDYNNNKENSNNESGEFNSTVRVTVEGLEAKASQNSNITIENNKLTLTGTGYANVNADTNTIYLHAESSIDLSFTIDQNYFLSLSGTLYSTGNSSSEFWLTDENNDQEILYKNASAGTTTLNENLILSSGKYSLGISATAFSWGGNGKFENINLTLEPVPIPQSFWLLCSGSILILLYARRQVMA